MTFASTPRVLAFISNNLEKIAQSMRHGTSQDGLPGVADRPLMGRAITFREADGSWKTFHTVHLAVSSLAHWSSGAYFDVVNLFPFKNGELYRVLKPHTASTIDADIAAGLLEQVSGFDIDLGDWAPFSAYPEGTMLEYNGQLIKAVQGHISKDRFSEDAAAGLWEFLANTKVTTTTSGDGVYSFQGQAVDDSGKLFTCVTSHDATSFDSTAWSGGGAVAQVGQWAAVPTYTVATGRTISTSQTLLPEDANTIVLVDTRQGGIELALFAPPQVGDTLYLADAAQSWDTHPLVLASNKFFSVTSTQLFNTKGAQVQLVYRGTGIGWTVLPIYATGQNVPVSTLTTSRTISSNEVVQPSDLGKVLMLDSRAGSFSITLPANPQMDDTVYFQDGVGSLSTHPVLLSNNNFYGRELSFTLSQSNLLIGMTWRGLAAGWTLTPLVQTPGEMRFAPSMITGRFLDADAVLTPADYGTAVGVNTNGGLVQISLPTNPSVDDSVALYDPHSTWAAYPVVVQQTQIFGRQQAMSLSTDGSYVIFTYRGGAVGWSMRASDSLNYTTINRGLLATGRLITGADQLVADTDSNKVVLLDSSARAFELQLPANPQINQLYYLQDAAFSWGTHPVTLSSSTYFSHVGVTYPLDMAGGTVALVYRGAPVGWTIGHIDALADPGPLQAIMGLKADKSEVTAEAAARTAALMAVNTHLSTVDQHLTALDQAHALETAARLAAEQAAAQALFTETVAREAGDLASAQALDVEVQARVLALANLTNTVNLLNAAFASLQTNVEGAVSQEVVDRNLALAALNTQLTTTISNLSSAVNNLANDQTTNTLAFNQSLNALSGQLGTESQARQTGYASLNSAINSEVTTRLQSEALITLSVQQLQTALADLQTTLSANLSNEATQRHTDDLALTTRLDGLANQISAEGTQRMNQDGLLDTAIADEIQARTLAISGVQTELDALTLQVTNLAIEVAAGGGGGTIDPTLLTDITTRLTAVELAVTAAQTAINQEAQTRSTSDQTLLAGLNTEIQTRTAEILAVNTALSTQAAAQTAVTDGLRVDLTSEISDRLAAGQAQATALDGEVAARTAAVKVVADGLAGEVLARTQAVASEATARGLAVQAVADGLTTEVSERIAAVSGISTALATEADTRAVAIASANQALATETTTRAGQVAALQLADTNEADARAAAVQAVALDLASEVNNRNNQVSAVQQSVMDEITARQASDSANAAAQLAEKTAREAADAGLDLRITAEVSTRTALTDSLTQGLADEGVARTGAISTLTNNLNTEAQTRATADASLRADLNSEINQRGADIDAVNLRVTNEIADRGAAVTGVQTALTSEVQTRATQVAALQTQFDGFVAGQGLDASAVQAHLDAEITNRTAITDGLRTDLTAETQARTTAVAAANTAISNEATTRAAAVQQVTDSVTTEAATRSTQVQTLTTNLAAEADTRTTQVAAINLALTNETAARAALADAVGVADANEAAAREAADLANSQAIASEVNNRTTAVASVQTNLDNEVTARTAADTNETSARTAADTALQNQITVLAPYIKNYSVAPATSVTMEVSTGSSALVAGSSYRIKLMATGTSSLTGAVYLLTASAAGTWVLTPVTRNLSAGANYPQLSITGSTVSIFHNHATLTYNVRVFVETVVHGNTTAVSPLMFGADAVLSYDDATQVVTLKNHLSVTNLAYSGTLTGGAGVINIASGQIYKDASGNLGLGTTTLTGLLTTKTALNTVQQHTVQADSGTANGKIFSWVFNRFNYDAAGTAAEINIYRGGNGYNGEIEFATNAGGAAGAVATARLRITLDGHLKPMADSTYTCGLSTNRWSAGYFTNLDYNGTLTGGAGVVNIGSGQFYKDASGNVTVGSVNTYSLMTVEGAAGAVTGNAQKFLLSLVDTAAVASGVGGGIVFFGNYTGTTKIGFAGVQGIKENATAGDTAGALILTTRVNGANLAEVARYSSAGHHLPKTTAAQDQGSSSLRWNNQYAVNVDYSGTLTGTTGVVNFGGQVAKDASGRWLVGSTTALQTDLSATATSFLQVQGLNDSTASAAVMRYSADAVGAHLYLTKSRGATVGAAGLVSAADVLGEVGFMAHDGSTGLRRAGFIRGVAEQTPAAGDVPAGLSFGISYAASGTWTESWHMDSYGRLYSQQAAPRVINTAGGGTAGAVNLIHLETVRANTWSGLTAVTHSTTASLGPTIALARTRGAAVGDVTAVQSGDTLGGVNWAGADGTNIRAVAAEITAVAAAAPATGSLPGKLYVSTTAVGGTSPTRRAYWDEVGTYLPTATTTYDIGSTTARWKGVYAAAGDYSGNMAIGANLTVAGTATITGAVTLTAGLSMTQVKDENGTYLTDDTVKNNLLSAPRWGSSLDGWNPYGIQGTNSTAWVTMPNGEQGLVWQGDSIVGNLNWFAGPYSAPVAIKNDRTYRLLIPVRRTSANTDSQILYVGATPAGGVVDTLNTSVTNVNGYFATLQLSSMAQNKWYLVEAYIYPAGVTGLTQTGAIYDMDTGARVGNLSAVDFSWDAAATVFRLRSGLYRSSAATQICTVQWGKPRFEMMDGAESDPTMLFANQGGSGNNLGLVGTNVTIRGNKILKTGGVTNTWDAGAYSKVGYTNGCYLRMRVSSISNLVIFGLNSDPATDANYTGIDYSFYIVGTSSLNIRESGAAIDAVATVAVGDILTIIYDGDTIVYQLNGTVLRTTAARITVPLYFDCSLYTLNQSFVEDVEFGPLNSINNANNMLEDLFDLPTAENNIQYVGSSYEAVNMACVADVAGSLAGKYVRLYGAAGTSTQLNPAVAEQIIDVWFQVSGSGTQPASGASRWIQVNIATNATAAAVATAIADTLLADAAFQTTGTDGAGNAVVVAATPANHTAATAGTSGFTVTILTNGSGTLTGTNLYAGGALAPNGLVYGVPYNATSVITIDPDTGATTTFGNLAGSSKYIGMALARDGKFYCPPAGAGAVLVIDPANNTTYNIGSALGPYRGCALAPNGKIYCVSLTTGNILVIDPATQTVSTLGSGLGSYYGIVNGMDGKLYGVPYDATAVLCIDPMTNTYSTFGNVTGTGKYLSAVTAQNGKIYCIPYGALTVTVIDPVTKTVSSFGNLTGSAKWGSGRLGPNGKIYCMPRSATTILVIDPEQNTTTTLGNFANSDKWIGTVLAPNGKLIGLPFNALCPIAIGGGVTAFPAWYLSAHYNNS